MGVLSVNRVCPEHTCQFDASGYYSDDMMSVGYKRSGEQALCETHAVLRLRKL